MAGRPNVVFDTFVGHLFAVLMCSLGYRKKHMNARKLLVIIKPAELLEVKIKKSPLNHRKLMVSTESPNHQRDGHKSSQRTPDVGKHNNQ